MEAPPAKRPKRSDSDEVETAVAVVPTMESHSRAELFKRKHKNKKKKGGGWRKRQDAEAHLGSPSPGPADSTTDAASKSGWAEYSLTNDLLLKYYREQAGLIPPDEWEAFETHLRMDLPSTFRISGRVIDSGHRTVPLAAAAAAEPRAESPTVAPFPLMDRIMDILHRRFMPVFGGSLHFKLGALGWFPKSGAWQFAVPPRKLKRESLAISAEADKLKADVHDFHEFLVAAAQVGAVTRQEAVSMIPVLFLDIASHHWVLDMCAAPGSKTTQLVEALHMDSATSVPSGLVVANDVNPQRCNTLIAQVKRLDSPAFLVTQHEAQLFPNPRGAAPAADAPIPISGKARSIFYDRILCDVPCSGDGTIRKTPEIWSRWSVHGGLGLHVVQLRILMRAFNLLRPAAASRIVYSTCSLNPVEDEAVIAQALLQSKGALELVDISSDCTKLGLKCQPGLPTWRVMDKTGNWFSSYAEVPEEKNGAIQATHFPPESTPFALNLERCCRFLPHLQDTGGFFVAVLQLRTSSSDPTASQSAAGPPSAASELSAAPPVDRADRKQATEKPTHRKIGELPFVAPPQEFFSDVWPTLKDFFGLVDTFPTGSIVSRSHNFAKLFFTSPGARALLASDTTQLLRFKHMGVRLFERMSGLDTSAAVGGAMPHEGEADEGDAVDEVESAPSGYPGPSRCGYRLCQEGARVLADPSLTDGRRVAHIGREDLLLLLNRKECTFGQFSAEACRKIEGMEVGSLVLVADELRLCFAGWRGSRGCHIRISQMDKRSFLSLIEDAQSPSRSSSSLAAVPVKK